MVEHTRHELGGGTTTCPSRSPVVELRRRFDPTPHPLLPLARVQSLSRLAPLAPSQAPVSEPTTSVADPRQRPRATSSERSDSRHAPRSAARILRFTRGDAETSAHRVPLRGPVRRRTILPWGSIPFGVSHASSDQHRAYPTRLRSASRLSQPRGALLRSRFDGLVSCRLHPWDSELSEVSPSQQPPRLSPRPAPRAVRPGP